MRLTASSLAAVELCPARAHLPQYPRTHADATAGIAAHAVLETEAPPGTAEVVYGYNVVTGEVRAGQAKKHRDYPDLGDEWIWGTADMVEHEAERVVITDWKTGFGYMVEPARSNLQLGFYAMAAALDGDFPAARVEIRNSEKQLIDSADLDSIDLDALRVRIEAIRAVALASGRGPAVVRPGDRQCWRCPCFAGCPAQTGLALTLSSGVDARELPTLDLTPEAVAKGWAKLKQIKAVLHEIERAYRGFASSNDVPLGGGKVLGVVDKRRESIDGKVALRVLTAAHGADVANAACEVETSKTAIERAIKSVAKKGTAAGLVRDALAAIDAANGISTKTTQSVEEHAQ